MAQRSKKGEAVGSDSRDFGSSSIGAGKGRPSLRIASLDPLTGLTVGKGRQEG
ncbi:Uncharacterised protein [uncultured archaeon]|nr:Uncharacterised protein [uncultured archaeon]